MRYTKIVKKVPLFPLIPIVPAMMLIGSLTAAIRALIRVRRLERRVASAGAV